MKPLFTTKHYKAIAEELNNQAINDTNIVLTFENIVDFFCEFLSQDNPKFNYKKFTEVVYKPIKS